MIFKQIKNKNGGLIMRRSDREMVIEDALDLLNRCQYGVLSTVGEGNYPLGTPLSYVFFNGALYFHCALEGEKLNNINNNNNVCFTVVGNTKLLPDKFSTIYESVIVKGKAYLLNDEEKAKPLEALIEKYSKDFLKEGLAYIERAKNKTCVIKIEPLSITGKHRIDK